VGHSAGGLLATKVAESESVAAVVALAPAVPKGISTFSPQLLWRCPRYLVSVLTQRAWIFNSADMAALNLNCLPEALQRQVYERMEPIDPQQVWDIVVRGIPVHAERVTVPQLLIAGQADALTPVAALKATAKRYGADFYVYPHHAHYLMYEPGWAKIATEILQWLQVKVSTSV
jgi:alpha-beta hydrolase superfamily lysophospholipase